jgi:WD40 repeat protein
MQNGKNQSNAASVPATQAGRVRGGLWPPALDPLALIADNQRNLPLLAKQLKSRVGVVPFVGAGMSVPFGFPAWRPFLEAQAPDTSVRQQVVGLLDRGQYEEAAELLLTLKGKDAFQAVLADTFGENRLPNPLPSAAILQLPRLSSGPVLTTNFDPVLERVFDKARRPFEQRILGMNVKAIREAFDQGRRVLLKLHGDAADQSSRVLTLSDYEVAYGEEEPLKPVLRFVMQARPLLFLGCSLGSDRTVRVLDALAGELRRQKAGDLLANFAVVERPIDEAELAARHEKLTQLGILPIWYPTGQHSLVADLLAHLAALAGRDPVCGKVPKEPLHYLLREEKLSKIRDSLLSQDATTVALIGHGGTVGVQGMGGAGKTVLAAALTRDPAVQRAFPDGIFWLTVGRRPNLLGMMNLLAGWLLESEGPFTSAQAAQSAIRQAFAGRHALMILDDVWELDHAAALNLVSSPGSLLVTTRKREVLVGVAAQEISVDVLNLPEALRMLADWAGVNDPALLPEQATAVAQECGRLPLALAMIGSMVQLRPTAWPDALEFLRSRELEEFRRAFPDYPYPNLLRAIAVGVDELPSEDREHYLDLAVFPEDEPIPAGPLQVLWGLTPAKTRACIDRLVARSLATVQQVEDKTALELHDLQADYIHKQREQELPALHTRLLDGYAAKSQIRNSKSVVRDATLWAHGPNDGYFFQRLAWHFKQAGWSRELRSLLFDFNWLQAKLDATDPVALADDFEHTEGDEELRIVQKAIRLATYAIGNDKKQLASQLVGRLGTETMLQMQQLVSSACAWRGAPWLQPLNANLHPPSTGLLRMLQYHSGTLTALALSADGRRAVSGTGDGMLNVWDVENAQELRTLKGLACKVDALAISANGHCAVSSGAGRLQVWDLETGLEIRTFHGHDSWVNALALSADGRRAVSGARWSEVDLYSQEVKVWDIDGGRELWRLQSQEYKKDWVVAMSADGRRVACGLHGFLFKPYEVLSANGRRVVSGYPDGTLTVWDVESGRELQTFPRGHILQITAVALSADGRCLMSGSLDGTLMVWDVESGRELRTLQCHASIRALSLSADGRRAVSLSEGALKAWDIEGGRELSTVNRHASKVTAMSLSADGRRAASFGSSDLILRIWDVENVRELRCFRGHDNSISSVAMSADGRRAVSASSDGTLHSWDVAGGRHLRTFKGHAGWITAVAINADGRRAVSGYGVGMFGTQGEMKVWDVVSGRELRMLQGQDDLVSSVAMSADGRRVVSGSCNGTIRVWDANSGRQLRTFHGHNGSVDAVALSADGRQGVSGSGTLSGSSKGGELRPDFIKVWDVESGRELRRLHGHADGVYALATCKNGRLVVSGVSSGDLHIWDVESGRKLRTLVGHTGKVNAVTISADGRRAVSGADDQTVRAWDVENGRWLTTLTADSAINGCALTSDGRTIAVGEQSGRIHFLRLVLPDDPVK